MKAMIPEIKEGVKKARTRHPEWYRSCAGLEAEAVEPHFYANQGVCHRVDSTTALVAMPVRTRLLMSRALSTKSRSLPENALPRLLVTTTSPCWGATSSWISVPGHPR